MAVKEQKKQVKHNPQDNKHYRMAHSYMNMYVDSLVDEYKVKKENAYLAECIDKLVSELRGIKDTLNEIKEQNAVLTERVQYLDFTRLRVAVGTAPPAAAADKAKKAIKEYLEEDEFVRLFGHDEPELIDTLPEPLPETPPEPMPRLSAGISEPKPEPGPDPPKKPKPEPKPEPKPGPKPRGKAEKKPKNMMITIASNVLFYLCMVLLILGAVTFAQSDDTNKSLFGIRYYYIISGSMEPVYPIGSVVFTKVTPPEAIKVGDDITVYTGDGSSVSYLTHRVVELVNDGGTLAFRTKGVNNKSNDPTPYSADLLVGKVIFCIPVLGTVMTFVQTQLVFVVGIFVLLLLLSFMLKLLFQKEPPAEAAQSPEGKALEPEMPQGAQV